MTKNKSTVNTEVLSLQEESEWLQEQLNNTLVIQQEALFRTLKSLENVPLEIAEMFEDAGNRYIDMSLLIRARYLKAKKTLS